MAGVSQMLWVVGLALLVTAPVAVAREGDSDAPRRSIAPKPPEVELASKPTLYVVGYAHLDTEWRWAYPQTIREFIADTLHKNFDLFEKYPEYVFNFSGSRRYQMMREYYPAEYEKLKGYVEAGRWFPCGSSVDENDANVPSAESFVRQVMYGNKFFRREFGIASDEFMLPDCFGFPAALPTLLNHCGIQGFSTQKLTWGSPVGIPFKVGRWIGPDNSEVLAALDPGAYVGQVKENLANSESWKTRIDNNGKKSGVFVDYHYYGTGDMGGSPTPDSVAKVQESVNTDGAIRVITGPADWMFQAITPEMRKGLPTYKGELLLTEHSAGSITSQAYMKRWNRKNELLADAAERAAVGAWWLTGEEYPAQRLEDAWALVLGSQMHDILPGTSLPKAYEYAWNDEVVAGNIFSQVLTHAVDTISSQMDTHGQGTSVLVCNPLAIERTDAVDAKIPWTSEWRAVRVIGPDGGDVLAQVNSVEDGIAHVVFAPRVGPMSLSVFDVRPIAEEPRGLEAGLRVASGAIGHTLTSRGLNVTVDGNGDVSSVMDLGASLEMLAEPARLQLLYEKPKDWPAWNMDWTDRQLPPRSVVGQAGDKPAEITISERGPARVSLKVKREHEGSTFTQFIRLSGEGKCVEFDTHIDWNTQERSLKHAFVLKAANPKATYDIQTGAIERGNNNKDRYENPSHQWFDLTDPSGSYGVSVLSDSKYGSDKPDDRTLRLTLLYTPGVRGGYQDQGTQDIGRHEMLHALYPHAGDWSVAKTPEHAARLNSPLMAFVVPRHAGRMGKQISFGEVGGDGVQMIAMKKAEASDEVIVRLREVSGKRSEAVIQLGKGIARARRVDGQERATGGADAADVTGGALRVTLSPFSMQAYALTLVAPASKPGLPEAKTVAIPFDTRVATTNSARGEASIDAEKRSLAKEQLPREVKVNGVAIALGGDGGEAVACNGQEIALPSDSGGTVYVLAAARNEDRDVEFAVGNKKQKQRVQSWRGYLGQWDNRLWKGEVPEMAFQWKNEWAGLEPGYVKPAPVAWFNSHYHTPKGDAHYQYSYVFVHELEAPVGAKKLKLPVDPQVLVFGATMAEAKAGSAVPAWPLFDTLEDHCAADGEEVRISATGEINDAVTVAIRPGLYWREGAIRYTTDSTEVGLGSNVYAGPFTLNEGATIKAAMVGGDGRMGPTRSLEIQAEDSTPPRLVGVDACAGSKRVVLHVSEPLALRAGGGRVGSISHDRSGRVVRETWGERSVELELKTPLVGGETCELSVEAMDRAMKGNTAVLRARVEVRPPVYTLERFAPGLPPLEVKDVAGLPVKGSQPWTINCFIKMDKQPENRTLIAGFGRTSKTTGGDGRYLAKFSGGAHFWSHHGDLSSTSALDVGRWLMLTATFDGKAVRLYKDGNLIGENEGELVDDENVVRIAPLDPWEKERKFEGEIRDFTIWDSALSEDALKSMREEANLP